MKGKKGMEMLFMGKEVPNQIMTSGIGTSFINLAAKFSKMMPSDAAKNAKT